MTLRSRREVLASLSVAAAALPLLGFTPSTALAEKAPKTILPPRLKAGDTVGLICPAGAAFSKETVQITIESLEALGLKVKLGKHVYDRFGYLAGTDQARAEDVNTMFADKSVQGILAIHGGWGCARLLPLLDYKTIQKNPKPLIGYSDITALLLAINAKTGLVTFHGPVGSATWNKFSVDSFRQVLFDGAPTLFENPKEIGDNLTVTKDRITTITPGTARGKLIGGNLTVLTAIVGSDYLPHWKDAILFLEDTNEAVYRIDRMLTQLKLAGVLDQVKGVVFGKCSDCEPGKGSYGSLTLEEVLEQHLQPLKIPVYSGAMIGHITHKFTVPVGAEAEIDATAGTIKLLNSAVA
ncbi:microcin C7 resistance protein MccF [Rufibacter radiotolerans]|uniref:Microcin C7 resistance protein MccF n=1 Tax=Rufibacter radiotolerans TaxID=1379910 RepID=A0A0H4VM52_9BACT|nr:LD-carboxypeptidase [Rufibacter radiotolerans]AKQ46920.1 microcin C7 resistance protein MccF [Rufibacter radiotolerans]